MSVVQPINETDLGVYAARTLWGADGKLMETIDRHHIFFKLWEKWSRGEDRTAWAGQLPGPDTGRGQVPATGTINLLPQEMKTGGYAMIFGDARSQDTYEKWREKVDSWPDYLRAMDRRGRYVGRLARTTGV